MILNGKQMDAFEKYYHGDVIMQKNSNTAEVVKKILYRSYQFAKGELKD